MSRYSQFGKVARCGAVDSKYFGKYNKFEEDIEVKTKAAEAYKARLKALILEEPSMLDIRVGQAIEVLKEIKEKFNI